MASFHQLAVKKKEIDPELIKKQKSENSLLVDGYIRNIDDILTNTSIPLELFVLCENFCYVDIEAFITARSLLQIYENVRDALQQHNFLLVEKLSLYYIENRNNDKNMFHNILAMAYEQMKLSGKGEYHYKKAIEISPKNGIYYWNYSALLTMQQRYDEAVECLNKAIEFDPNDNNCYIFEKAQCLEKMNKMDEAMKEYTILTIPDGEDENGKNYLYEAIGFMKSGLIKDSNKMYEKYLENVDKEKVTTNTSYGRLLWVLQKYEEALIYLTKAIELKRENSFTLYYYGMILKHQNEYDEAIQAFENSLALCDVYKDCELALKEIQNIQQQK